MDQSLALIHIVNQLRKCNFLKLIDYITLFLNWMHKS